VVDNIPRSTIGYPVSLRTRPALPRSAESALAALVALVTGPTAAVLREAGNRYMAAPEGARMRRQQHGRRERHTPRFTRSRKLFQDQNLLPREAHVAQTRTAVVLALVEAKTMTGVAKNLFQLQRTARTLWVDSATPLRLELVLATFRRGSTHRGVAGELASCARRAGMRVVEIPERCRFDPGVTALLRRTVAAVEPHIVQTHSVKSHAIMRLAGIHEERPWIAFHHGYTRPDLKMRFYNQMDWWSLRSASRVVTPTRAFIPELRMRGVLQDAIAVVPNAIDVNVALSRGGDEAALRRSFGGATGDRIVVAIGRLSREKGHADLIRAVGLLRQRRPELHVRLVIAGDGPERASLTSLSDRMAPGAVQFLGYVYGAHRLYAVADLAVLPSHSEGSPNALLEAAAYGCPIVATAVGGVPDIVSDRESGLIVPAHDATALASAIELLLVDRPRARTYGECAHRFVAARYHPVARARTLLNLYAEVAFPRSVWSAPEHICAS